MQNGREYLVEITLFLRNALLLFAILIAVSLYIFPQFESVFFRLGIPLISLLMFISGTLHFFKAEKSFGRFIISVTLSIFITASLHYFMVLDPHEYPHLLLFFSAVYTGLAYVIVKSKETLAYLGIAIVCAGSVYVDISSEVLSRTNGNDILYLVKGDTIKMETYFICYPIFGDEMIFLERIPMRYEKGDIVKFDEMFFKAEETHLTSSEFFYDLEENWSIVPYPNVIQRKSTSEWKCGMAGDDITSSLHKSLWTSINTENIIEAISLNQTSIIAVKVTRYKLGLIVWFGVFLVALGIILLLLKRNHSAQITPE